VSRKREAIAMNAIVKDVMTTHVVAVPKTATFKEMATLLGEQRVSAFPVVDDDNKVIGVVSEADLLAKEALDVYPPGKVSGILHHREKGKAAGITAEDLMTTPPVAVGPRDFVADAARLMYARRVKRLPVVDEEGSLVGIVSRADVLSVYSRSDAAIRHDVIEGVILDTMLVDPARLTVTVSDGVVTLEGVPETASVGRDIVEAARHVEGVVAVRDRLSYPHAVREAAPVGPLF
jgi:CBS-domain-containing membrane protein